MSILKNLKFSTQEVPKSARSTVTREGKLRTKFTALLTTQISAIEGVISGIEYKTIKTRWQTTDGGERRKVEVQTAVRPCWFERDGEFFVAPKYGNKSLEITKGKPSIACGRTLEGVQKTLTQLKDATELGELDVVLAHTADAIRDRLNKNKS